ncbi:phosphopantothenoylcysteine decarboxylase [Drosophila sulfurigaster albostrigata]|uniref:phosphopantothenoylcysteine decarboxylase n=1 Tax=Drosophila sulfurigaster albostrigata TaxID=89887 RepID=UPI002D21D6D0|nr:phosphopantothenoylcysteine decarboxylase [Drosophila sulfurigaster albostrigata]
MGETGIFAKDAAQGAASASTTTTIKPERNVIIAATGSVATIKLVQLISELSNEQLEYKFNIKVIITEHAKHFFELEQMPENVPILHNRDEWLTWNKRGDPVLHIELGKWADMLLIAPLSANSLAKIATGICDNLVMCVVRAWDLKKPLLFAPAMNTRMYDHPITREQINRLISWGYTEIPCISKTLMCGDTGNGAMSEVATIVKSVVAAFLLSV